MAKSTSGDSLETVARLLDIVPFLSTHQGIALDELAKAFSVSADQMTKDLTTLWMCGLPGYTAYELIDLSFDSGFVTISNAETLEKPRALNRDEVLALLLGLESFREDLAESSQQTKTMIEQAIARLTELIGTVVSRRVQAGDSSDSAVVALLQSAISERTSVEIEYHSISRDELTKRIVNPFDLSSDGKFTYLYAYCEVSQGNRTFRVDRIVTASQRDVAKSSEPVKKGSASAPSLDATILVTSRKRDIAEKLAIEPFAASTSEEILLRCFSAEWAVREVMSFGGSAQVKQPHALRDAVLERSSRALAAYEG